MSRGVRQIQTKAKTVRKRSQLDDDSSESSFVSTMFSTRRTATDIYRTEINAAIEHRSGFQVFDKDTEGNFVDATPNLLSQNNYLRRFQNLRQDVRDHLIDQGGSRTSLSLKDLSSTRSSRLFAKLSIEDIMDGIGSARVVFDSETSLGSYSSRYRGDYPKPYIRLHLRKTEEYLLYEQRSSSVARGTSEAHRVDVDNREYEYLTTGKGRVRRRFDAETQTTEVLLKNRLINTIPVHRRTIGTFVSFSEMYDTFFRIRQVKPKGVIPPPKMSITSLRTRREQTLAIFDLRQFKLCCRIIKRLLASNFFKEGQRRYRSMHVPTKLTNQITYDYSLQVLFRFAVPADSNKQRNQRKAVADISFCPTNGDILAVAYGIYSFSAQHVPTSGHVRVWSIKNPIDYERYYSYDVPVMAVEFSPYEATLIAIGLYNGMVEVRNITHVNTPPLAISQRGVSPGCEPVIGLKWIKETEGSESLEVDPFLALSQNGSVTKFKMINSPYLLAFKQMELERVEGIPEGLTVRAGEGEEIQQQANRQPQSLSLTMHPLFQDVYYLLTDEGCLHKCSTNYPHQYLEVLKTHNGSVNTMDFSPWSPKLFVTCGNDWTIRIWVEGIFRPIITLNSHLAPVHCVYWSRTHSTMLVSLTRKYVDIWDIRRNILQPMSTTPLDSSFNTFAKFSRCGGAIAVGNERGNVLICAFNGLPFPPHFQYDELEKALYSSISTSSDLIFELRSVGFMGYPNKSRVYPR